MKNSLRKESFLRAQEEESMDDKHLGSHQIEYALAKLALSGEGINQ
jgi:hypothetical protein